MEKNKGFIENSYDSSYSRRKFINISSAGLCGVALNGVAAGNASDSNITSDTGSRYAVQGDTNLIGAYGEWAAGLMDSQLPVLSYRRDEWRDIETWRAEAKKRVFERIGMPDIGGMPKVKVNKQYEYDGLLIEELSWQLPYGRPAEAILLKPASAKGELPGILALHHHGGDKYFGKRKLVRTSDARHPKVVESQQQYY
ncbi:MAG: hypothetical protein PHH93_08200, partial [Prolixibacteraceae bacterium]|nr:hypothetical protein [Prolixibacteraceae bacterium]